MATKKVDLDRFVSQSERLLARPLMTEGRLGSGFTTSHDRSSNKVEMTINSTEADEFRSFMMDLRPFISEDEPVFVGKVVNLLLRELQGDEPQQQILSHQRQYKARMKKKVFAPAASTGLERQRDLVDAYLNGRMFHADADKGAPLEALEGAEGQMFAEIEFQETVRLIAHYVEVIAAVIVKARKSGPLP